MKEKIIKAYQERDKEWSVWREVMAEIGIEKTLEALNFPADPEAVYYNMHTGSEETLENLTNHKITGQVKEEDRAENLAMELEHWLPKLEDPNPVIARSLALSEDRVKDQIGEHLRHYAEDSENKEAFIDRCRDMGGTLEDGLYDNRGSKTRVGLHDGREFIFSLSEIYDRLKKPRTLVLFN